MRSPHRPGIALVSAALLAVVVSVTVAAGRAAPPASPPWARISGPAGAGAQLGLGRTLLASATAAGYLTTSARFTVR